MKKQYLECGKIINTHGFRGTVKLECWCDSPQILAGLSTLYVQKESVYVPIRVLRTSVFRQFVLADLEGVDSEEKAEALRNTVVFAHREEIPVSEGSHFIVDLIGLAVKDADSGAVLGTLEDVRAGGAGDLYLVRTETDAYWVPAVPQFIDRIDPDDAVYIRPIEGLLDGRAENV